MTDQATDDLADVMSDHRNQALQGVINHQAQVARDAERNVAHKSTAIVCFEIDIEKLKAGPQTEEALLEITFLTRKLRLSREALIHCQQQRDAAEALLEELKALR